MPMVYRSPPWLAELKREKSKEALRTADSARPVSDIGGGRSGVMQAFATGGEVAR